jgi:hypothetical protein
MKKANLWKMTLACTAIVLTLAGTALAGDTSKAVKGAEPTTEPAPVYMAKAVELTVDKVNKDVNQVTVALKEKTKDDGIRLDRIEFVGDEALLYYTIVKRPANNADMDVKLEPKAVTYVASSYRPAAVDGATAQPIGGGSSAFNPGSGCSQTQSFDIRGTITELHRKAGGTIGKPTGDPNQAVSNTNSGGQKEPASNTGPVVGFFIQGDSNVNMPYDQASVRITDETKIYKQQGSGLILASVDNLSAGTVAEVYFEGPVAESYPVQATAGKIIIVE